MNFLMQDNWHGVSILNLQKIRWINASINESKIIFKATFHGQELAIRLNDFPDEPLYTLLVDKVEVIHFNDWPKFWEKEDF